MKNNLTVGIAVLVVLGAAAWMFGPSFLGFWRSALEPSPLAVGSVNEAVSDSLPDLGGEVSYDVPEYGLSFSFVSDYLLSEEELGTGERGHYRITLLEDTPENKAVLSGEALGREGPTAITLDIYQNNLDKQKLTDWLKKTSFSNFKLSDGTYQKTEIAGVPALFYSWSGLYEGNSFVFEHQNNIVMATVTYLTPEDAIVEDFSSVLSSLELY